MDLEHSYITDTMRIPSSWSRSFSYSCYFLGHSSHDCQTHMRLPLGMSLGLELHIPGRSIFSPGLLFKPIGGWCEFSFFGGPLSFHGTSSSPSIVFLSVFSYLSWRYAQTPLYYLREHEYLRYRLYVGGQCLFGFATSTS